ncbi:Uncharacterized membrane-anchored protein YitT, contains DUF161 and DUF2179 domains [Acetitomaculum ruminis DSM 5522]|uniref:Uncharacterized membrane-anchored protein YitT, contains DUF161 and DUF2179 domains n=1 Tax=Acetitomaculum ruminis DSM 5522 TaxID=1120918 RepID=A0A1I0YAY3_9FIRM|nr:YitT family protein [Acetitomaculum ruminis]SFB09967.1 Uncharacterized membrane-anchored protein YitT, contains DUF161 and DUF2179 domains [Acetitomaculum ruminis DSM 5522]
MKRIKTITAIMIASVIMALNINIFVHTGGLYPGGVNGLTVLIQRIGQMYLNINIPYTVVNLILNGIPIYVGFRFIGKKFTFYSCMTIVLTNILIDLLPTYVITYDTLLISIFGGILNGFSIGICLRANATSGGTDFIAIYFSEKKGVDTWNYVLVFNVCILAAAGCIFGWEKALYSIIFQFVSTQMMKLMYHKYQQETLLVVTNRPQEVIDTIYNICHHGATLLDGEGGYEKCKKLVVYSVISKDKKQKTINAIKKVDNKAFINVIRTEEVIGHFYCDPRD